ncbi:MAG: SRPBCC family protein [Betaproteobacteria bacterium]
MRFEHLIEINDPANPLIPQLSRAEVWRGLMYRVENPVLFLPGLETCTILERGPSDVRRELHFGNTVVHDAVDFDEGERVRFVIAPSANHAGGELTISIEEPAPEHLFLRFAYRTTLAEGADWEDTAYIEYVKSAYHASDIDCVQIIRVLAAGGTPQ